MKSFITIGELAKKSGVGHQAIRFYERKGLLPEPQRSDSGYRVYREEDSARLRFIKNAQEIGFTLGEIRELLEINCNPKSTCRDVQNKALTKVEEVEVRIRNLLRMKKALIRLSQACGESKKAMSECEILNCFDEGWKC